jgi:hypothetical protein
MLASSSPATMSTFLVLLASNEGSRDDCIITAEVGYLLVIGRIGCYCHDPHQQVAGPGWGLATSTT